MGLFAGHSSDSALDPMERGADDYLLADILVNRFNLLSVGRDYVPKRLFIMIVLMGLLLSASGCSDRSLSNDADLN